MKRRDFIKYSSSASLYYSSLPLLPALSSKVNRYKTALIGTGWWGMNILREAIRAGESQVVALCDVDENQLNNALKEFLPCVATVRSVTVILENCFIEKNPKS
jgi:FlaA1/EpsC-like NDP-sugar epimerase